MLDITDRKNTSKLSHPFSYGNVHAGFYEDLDNNMSESGLSTDCLEETSRVQADDGSTTKFMCLLPLFILHVSKFSDIRVNGRSC
jgi:hypothetical protein